jgi:hypothetical protein
MTIGWTWWTFRGVRRRRDREFVPFRCRPDCLLARVGAGKRSTRSIRTAQHPDFTRLNCGEPRFNRGPPRVHSVHRDGRVWRHHPGEPAARCRQARRHRRSTAAGSSGCRRSDSPRFYTVSPDFPRGPLTISDTDVTVDTSLRIYTYLLRDAGSGRPGRRLLGGMTGVVLTTSARTSARLRPTNGRRPVSKVKSTAPWPWTLVRRSIGPQHRDACSRAATGGRSWCEPARTGVPGTGCPAAAPGRGRSPGRGLIWTGVAQRALSRTATFHRPTLDDRCCPGAFPARRVTFRGRVPLRTCGR